MIDADFAAMNAKFRMMGLRRLTYLPHANFLIPKAIFAQHMKSASHFAIGATR